MVTNAHGRRVLAVVNATPHRIFEHHSRQAGNDERSRTVGAFIVLNEGGLWGGTSEAGGLVLTKTGFE